MDRASEEKDSRNSIKNKPTQATKDRILVVNDEEEFCEIVSSILTSAGYQCRTASDGLHALAVLNSGEEFELLIANLNMPGLDGISLLIRTKEQFPDMPVVIETATPDLCFGLQAIRNGAYDYMVGPFEREQLLNVVRRALEYRRLKLANREYEKKLGTLTIPTAYESKRILVQHNDETMREIVSSMLTGARHECRGAASPAEAWDILCSGAAVDLLLCKVMESLEEELIERVVERFPDIPAIVWGNRPIPMFLEAVRKGAYDYLLLPFEREQLLVIVRRALEYRHLRLENRAYLQS
jgi:DNA-binding NtrC family response regulator